MGRESRGDGVCAGRGREILHPVSFLNMYETTES